MTGMKQVDPPSACIGCGAVLDHIDGPTHRYMASSPACFAQFNTVLACEYSDPALQATHRLTVDTYAVQHPGSGRLRQEIQSVGLHLARLMLQLENPRPPRETNDVMLGLSRSKASLIRLAPPKRFTMTIADVSAVAGQPEHASRVKDWARSTWADWSEHHHYIRDWTALAMRHGRG